MQLPSISFLGPAGSFTELALKEHLKTKVVVPCSTISEVFTRLKNGETAYGFVPVENVLQGSIAETYDCLLKYKGQITILCSFLSRIVHTLGIHPGTDSLEQRLGNITQVFSHEQALRQCASYLRQKFPKAELVQANSTGAAAETISNKKLLNAAVVAAKATLLQHQFEIIGEDIADRKDNQTRFVLLGRGDAKQIINSPETEKLLKGLAENNTSQVTSIALRPGRDRQGILFEVLGIISSDHRINLLSIHSRPDERGVFVFHFDLEGHIKEQRIQTCLRALETYCQETTNNVAEVVLFGSYPQRQFYELPFKTIGIVGGAGVMGKWFCEFFSKTGLEVLVNDIDCGVSLEELTKRAEVIILSVPMSSFHSVTERLAPLLRPGHLVVENSSIKSCSLPILIHSCPPGVEVMGLHTMFGASVESIRGENVIVTQTPSSAEKAQALQDLLYKHGAKITYADITTHDKMSAYLQALMQASLIALAEVMRETFPDAESLEPFTTPNSRGVLESMKRVVSQSDSLLVDLQTLNSQYPELRRVFLQSVFNLLSGLEHGQTTQILASAQKSRQFFKD